MVERDDGWIGLSQGAALYFAPRRDWTPLQRELVARARGRVLDVGCGAGRCALHLQERGLRVVGIDVSPLAVRTCRLRGVRDARVLSVTGISKRLGRFDTVLMMGHNLGLLGGERRTLVRGTGWRVAELLDGEHGRYGVVLDKERR